MYSCQGRGSQAPGCEPAEKREPGTQLVSGSAGRCSVVRSREQVVAVSPVKRQSIQACQPRGNDQNQDDGRLPANAQPPRIRPLQPRQSKGARPRPPPAAIGAAITLAPSLAGPHLVLVLVQHNAQSSTARAPSTPSSPATSTST
jgi:hypothetical protein